MSAKWVSMAGIGIIVMLVLYACVSDGPGSDFDLDGLRDDVEDSNDNFSYDPGESDFVRPDTDNDGICDGRADTVFTNCGGCEDCNLNRLWEPCLSETDLLNGDTDNDGILDREDPAPLDNLGFDCSGGNNPGLLYGSSLPDGKPFPVRPTATASPAPFPTSTPRPDVVPTVNPFPTATPTP